MTDPGQTTAFQDARLGADLLWREVRVARFSSPTPALFLDRDGVIIEEKKYISDPAAVQLVAGIAELIRTAREAGFAIVEITNQAGIGRGFFGWAEFLSVEKRVTELLAGQSVQVDAVFACPFHSEGQSPYRVPDHPWRKPNPGMLREAAFLMNLDLARSMVVGDNEADQLAGRAAGLACGIHVLTGHGQAYAARVQLLHSKDFPTTIARNPKEAAQFIGPLGGTGPATLRQPEIMRSRSTPS